jgi:hypothetical protein
MCTELSTLYLDLKPPCYRVALEYVKDYDQSLSRPIQIKYNSDREGLFGSCFDDLRQLIDRCIEIYHQDIMKPLVYAHDELSLSNTVLDSNETVRNRISMLIITLNSLLDQGLNRVMRGFLWGSNFKDHEAEKLEIYFPGDVGSEKMLMNKFIDRRYGFLPQIRFDVFEPAFFNFLKDASVSTDVIYPLLSDVCNRNHDLLSRDDCCLVFGKSLHEFYGHQLRISNYVMAISNWVESAKEVLKQHIKEEHFTIFQGKIGNEELICAIKKQFLIREKQFLVQKVEEGLRGLYPKVWQDAVEELLKRANGEEIYSALPNLQSSEEFKQFILSSSPRDESEKELTCFFQGSRNDPPQQFTDFAKLLSDISKGFNSRSLRSIDDFDPSRRHQSRFFESLYSFTRVWFNDCGKMELTNLLKDDETNGGLGSYPKSWQSFVSQELFAKDKIETSYFESETGLNKTPFVAAFDKFLRDSSFPETLENTALNLELMQWFEGKKSDPPEKFILFAKLLGIPLKGDKDTKIMKLFSKCSVPVENPVSPPCVTDFQKLVMFCVQAEATKYVAKFKLWKFACHDDYGRPWEKSPEPKRPQDSVQPANIQMDLAPTPPPPTPYQSMKKCPCIKCEIGRNMVSVRHVLECVNQTFQLLSENFSNVGLHIFDDKNWKVPDKFDFNSEDANHSTYSELSERFKKFSAIFCSAQNSLNFKVKTVFYETLKRRVDSSFGSVKVPEFWERFITDSFDFQSRGIDEMLTIFGEFLQKKNCNHQDTRDFLGSKKCQAKSLPFLNCIIEVSSSPLFQTASLLTKLLIGANSIASEMSKNDVFNRIPRFLKAFVQDIYFAVLTILNQFGASAPLRDAPAIDVERLQTQAWHSQSINLLKEFDEVYIPFFDDSKMLKPGIAAFGEFYRSVFNAFIQPNPYFCSNPDSRTVSNILKKIDSFCELSATSTFEFPVMKLLPNKYSRDDFESAMTKCLSADVFFSPHNLKLGEEIRDVIITYLLKHQFIVELSPSCISTDTELIKSNTMFTRLLEHHSSWFVLPGIAQMSQSRQIPFSQSMLKSYLARRILDFFVSEKILFREGFCDRHNPPHVWHIQHRDAWSDVNHDYSDMKTRFQNVFSNLMTKSSDACDDLFWFCLKFIAYFRNDLRGCTYAVKQRGSTNPEEWLDVKEPVNTPFYKALMYECTQSIFAYWDKTAREIVRFPCAAALGEQSAPAVVGSAEVCIAPPLLPLHLCFY